MKRNLAVLAMCLIGLGSATGSKAGCLTGAAVGGVAGHVAGHHAVLGAAVGCAVGHHRAAEQKRQSESNRTDPPK
jgi:phage tail tape-measure protein